MSNEEKLNELFVKNAIKEMKQKGLETLDYAKKLENAYLDVEQEALIEAFEREFNHKFSKVQIKV